MASSKLTLSIEPDVIDQAKKYARQKHTSLSKLVQNYLKDISKNVMKSNNKAAENLDDEEISPDILALTGILKGKVPNDINLWDAKYEYLKEKYDL